MNTNDILKNLGKTYFAENKEIFDRTLEPYQCNDVNKSFFDESAENTLSSFLCLN